MLLSLSLHCHIQAAPTSELLFWDIIHRTASVRPVRSIEEKTHTELREGMALTVCHGWSSELLCHSWECCLPFLGVLSHPWGSAGCPPVLRTPSRAACTLLQEPGGSAPGVQDTHTGAGRLSHTTPNKMFGVCHGLSAAALTSDSFCFLAAPASP